MDFIRIGGRFVQEERKQEKKFKKIIITILSIIIFSVGAF